MMNEKFQVVDEQGNVLLNRVFRLNRPKCPRCGHDVSAKPKRCAWVQREVGGKMQEAVFHRKCLLGSRPKGKLTREQRMAPVFREDVVSQGVASGQP